MNDPAYGILTISICAIGYYFSWRYYSKHNFTIALLLLMLCGLALRIYASCDFFLHEWDERYHALVAKNLIQHPLTPTLYDNPILNYDYKNWPANHIWLEKPPLPLWCMSLSIFLFGNNDFAVRIPSVLVSTFSIFLTFRIAQILFNNKIAWLAAFLHSIHGMLIELSAGRISSDHVETFFIFFVELSILMGILSFVKNRGWQFVFLCGAFTGCAFLSKFLPAFIVLPLWLSIAILYKKESSKKIIIRFAVMLLVAITISGGWIAYTYLSFPDESKEMIRSLTNRFPHVIQNHTGPPWYYVNKIRMIFGELIYLPLLWLLYRSYKEIKSVQYIPILLWIVIPLIVFSAAHTKRYTYLLLASPAIFIVSSCFWHWLKDYKKGQEHTWIFNLILFLLIALPIRYTIERLKPFVQRERNPQWAIELKNLKDKTFSKGVLFNYDRPIEAMFYTNLTAYSVVPDERTIRELIANGYSVIFNDKGVLPSYIERIKEVRIINLTGDKGADIVLK